VAPKNVIIDCDTGVDDAIALTMALRSPELNVMGITTVAGNAVLANVVRNTLTVVEHSGKVVPVYVGADRPLMGAWETAEHAHGADGLADIKFPAPKLEAEKEHAVNYIVRAFMESEEPLHLITLGPLTNVALALAMEPRLVGRIQSITMMAGGIDAGNATPAAEFNIWVDPEAADLVFRSGIPLTMIALDPIVQGGKIYREDVEILEQAGSSWCSLTSQLFRWYLARYKEFSGGERPVHPPDLLAVAVAIDPSFADCEMFHVVVECNGTHTRGMTLVDRRWYARHLGMGEKPNVNVVKTVDNDFYRKMVVETLTAK
jgi:inosine-uridine nucleoside N-ribohydrolase